MAEKIAQWFKALGALSEDPSSVTRDHARWLTTPVTPSWSSNNSDLHGQLNSYAHTHTSTHN